jgi:phosphoenolpyruvate carboxylase
MPDPEPEWTDAMARLSEDAHQAYCRGIRDNPSLMEYFQQTTPIGLVADLRIGSRPAKRKTGDRLEDLRAIPWVFSWTQSRNGLPGWYGLGSAFEAFRAAGGEPAVALLRRMTREWPFFRSLLENAQMSLGRSDRAVARLYASLADPDLGPTVLSEMEAEWERSEAGILAVTGRAQILAGTPVLLRTIRLRNPSDDPMSFLQVSLLRRWRALPEGSPEREDVRRVLA